MTDAAPIAATRGLHHYGLTVSDLEVAIAWYTRLLGLRPGPRWTIADGAIRIALLLGEGFAIELFEIDEPRDNPTQGEDVATSLATRGLRHIALRVDSVADVHAACVAAGLDIALAPSHSEAGFAYCFVRDPDGNQIEFVELDADPHTQAADLAGAS